MGIKLKAVSKSYKDKQILSQVTFEISDGEFLMIQGESGAGKSTLLNIIGGLESATSGTITISGYDISDMKRKERVEFYRNTVGFIYQGFYLQPELNIRDNISLSGVFANLPKKEMKARTERIAKKLGISDVLKSKPEAISGGQAERACIGRAFFMNPKIILADEPTNNLDPKNAENVISMLSDYAKEAGATIIIASHDKMVEKFATRKVELRDGRLIEL